MTVEIARATRRFGTAAALDGVSLSVDAGEFVALLGPSGSGKTTLLRAIAGLEALDAGTIAIAGRDMTNVPARDRGIGVVFQHYALFRHMTVFENVAFGLRVRPRATRPAEAEIAQRVRALLDLVQIPELERRLPHQVSGGQRQRVALARALAIEPRLLLLDEPFGALDARIRKDVRRWLRGLHDRLDLATILVTHDQDEAMELADRVAVMQHGRIAQYDPPARLLSDPATAFVAGFVGERIRLAGLVRGGWFHAKDLDMPPIATTMPDGTAEAVVAPEDLLADPTPGAPGALATIALQGGPAHRRVVVRVGDKLLDASLVSGSPPAVRGTEVRVRAIQAIIYAIPDGRPGEAPSAVHLSFT